MKVHFESISKKNKTFKIPYFLNDSHIEEIFNITEYFESLLGKKKTDLNNHVVLKMLSNKLVAQGLIDVISKWFYNLEGLQPSPDPIPASERRIRFYQFLGTTYRGWINPKNKQLKELFKGFLKQRNKDEVHKDFEGKSKLNENKNNRDGEHFANNKVITEITDYLYSDHKINFHIKRRGIESSTKPNPQIIIKRYNTEVIRQIFSKSTKMIFKLPKPTTTPQLIKSIFRNSKMWGIYTEVEEIGEFIQFTSAGPEELLGQQTKYGKLLYALFYSIASNINSINTTNQTIDLQLDYIKDDSVLNILLPVSKILSQLPLDQVFQDRLSSPFDSSVEEQFARKFTQSMDGWELQNEAVIIKENSIFIPDFILRYRDTKVIVEIVGFWTKNYLEKKAKKLELFSKYFNNIVVLVDEKLDFPDFPNQMIRMFRYGRRMNINKFNRYITANYQDQASLKHFNKLNLRKIRIVDLIRSKLETNPFVDEDQLQAILDAKSAGETKRLLELLFSDQEFDNFTIFPFYNSIFRKDFIERVGNKLKKLVSKNGAPKEKIEETLQMDTRTWTIMLNYLGYQEKYTSLSQITIFPPS